MTAEGSKVPERPLVRIATRGSKLALWQAEHVRSLILKQHPDIAVELVVLKTKGDLILDRPLAEVGGKGFAMYDIGSKVG